jgi:hypothetical protein
VLFKPAFEFMQRNESAAAAANDPQLGSNVLVKEVTTDAKSAGRFVR